MFDSDVLVHFIDETKLSFPVVTAKNIIDPIGWFKANKELINDYKLKYGGLLFRDFKFCSVSEFNNLVTALEPNLLDYKFRSTPRTKLGGKIYSASEYPQELSIPLHNENSYTNSWPNQIFFFCVLAPDEGGQTPIADARKIYNLIDPAIREKFEANGVMYTRSFIPGIDLSWQEVFQTESKNDVNIFCETNNIDFQWKESNNCALKIKQVCQATLQHPTTRESVWFNQAHLFHVSSLPKQNIDFLVSEVGKDNLPRSSYYGNGDEIEYETLNHIRECYDKEKIMFSWREGDLMILDNILFAHARQPFKGPRKIVVAMS